MVYKYKNPRHFLLKLFFVHIRPSQFFLDLVQKLFFPDEPITTFDFSFSLLAITAVPRLIRSRTIECTAQKRSTTFPTEYFSVEEVMLPIGLIYACLCQFLSFFQYGLCLVPRFPVDDRLMVIVQIVGHGFSIGVRFLCQIVNRGFFLQALTGGGRKTLCRTSGRPLTARSSSSAVLGGCCSTWIGIPGNRIFSVVPDGSERWPHHTADRRKTPCP